MLDPDRTLVLAGTARRALPQHRLGVQVDELPLRVSGEQPLLRLEDDRFGVERLAGAEGRAIHLATAALHARERVEDALAPQVLHRLETDLRLLEVEVRQVPEFGRLQEHRDRREHEMEVLGGRNQRQKREDDD